MPNIFFEPPLTLEPEEMHPLAFDYIGRYFAALLG
jgi:hypothetical protein